MYQESSLRVRRFGTPLPVLACLVTAATVAVATGCGASSPKPEDNVRLPAPPCPEAAPDQAWEANVEADLVAPEFLDQFAATYRFRLGRPSQITITPDARAVLFIRSGGRSFDGNLYEVDVATGQERVLATAEQLLGGAAEALSVEEKARRERMRMAATGIVSYALSRDGKRVLVPLSGGLFVIDRATGAIQALPDPGGYPLDPQLSPDGTRVGYVVDGDLHVMDIATGSSHRVTQCRDEAVQCGLAEFVAQEEMGRYHGFWWAPDGARLAFQRTDEAAVEVLRIADPLHPEQPPVPMRYPRAGTANAAVQVAVVPVEGGDPTWLKWDAEAYPYVHTVTWEGGPLALVVENRTQSRAVLLEANANTGETTPLLVEEDSAWLNLGEEMPRWLNGGQRFLWTSEAEGAPQLQLRARDGSLLSALTPTELGYRRLVAVDAERGFAVVQAGPEPTEQHVYLVPLDPGRAEPEALTEGPGMNAAVFSDDLSIWVHDADSLQGRTQTVRKVDGEHIVELRSEAEPAPFPLNVTIETVQHASAFRAAVVRPNDFDSSRRYPVVDSVYGGPLYTVVKHSQNAFIFDQWLANQGFIVVRIDGRGTPWRGRDWERAIRGDFIGPALEDHVEALQALAQQHAELDLDHVGIRGWSFGGYFSAMAVMQRPDVFKVGVAGAPVVDWRDYDTHYTERYIGLPETDAAAYDRSSVLSYATELQRPLMVVHGTADDNVYFLHSLKLAEALFTAGKRYELLPLPGATHMVVDPAMLRRMEGRIVGFMAGHLR